MVCMRFCSRVAVEPVVPEGAGEADLSFVGLPQIEDIPLIFFNMRELKRSWQR